MFKTPESVKYFDDENPPQCTALTVRGRQCRNKVTESGQVLSGDRTYFYGTEKEVRQIEQLKCRVHVQ